MVTITSRWSSRVTARGVAAVARPPQASRHSTINPIERIIDVLPCDWTQLRSLGLDRETGEKFPLRESADSAAEPEAQPDFIRHLDALALGRPEPDPGQALQQIAVADPGHADLEQRGVGLG